METPPQRPRFRLGRFLLAALLVVALVAVAVGTALWAVRPRLTEREVDALVMTTLAEEAEASFLVTGTLSFGTTVSRERRREAVIPILGLDVGLGTARATVRVPGRVTYGFDVRALGAERVRLAEDGTVEVDLPALALFSVEPDLQRAVLRTEGDGLPGLQPSRQQVLSNTLGEVRGRMRQAAERHLATADQPRRNAAEAVARMLVPALHAAGVEAPRFRFLLAPGEVLALDATMLGGDAPEASGEAPRDS